MLKKTNITISRLFTSLTICFLISAVHLPVVWSQTGPPLDQAQTDETVNETSGDNAKVIVALQMSLAGARQDFQSAQSFFDSTQPEQIGATQLEVNQKLLLLKLKILIYEQHIDAYRTLDEISNAEHYLPETDKGPDRHREGPPYSVSIVDQVRDDIYNLKLKIDEKTTLRSVQLRNQSEARGDLKKFEQRLRLANEALER